MNDHDWQARALAAERTVEVLKRKVMELYDGVGSSIQHAFDRARARQADMHRRQELAALRNAELQRYSETLESEVRRRVREIQVIVDNVAFGFLVVGSDGKVRDGYTRSCHALLGDGDFTGAVAADVLRLAGNSHEMFGMQLRMLFDDVLPDEVVLDQFPKRTVGEAGRVLQLDGSAIRDGVGQLEAVLLTITDVTALVAAERENAHYRLLVSILRQRDAFAMFVSGFRALVHAGGDACANGDEGTARRAMHTIKGDAACFGLSSIAKAAHQFEEAPKLEPAHFSGLATLFDGFLAADREVLGAIGEEDTSLGVSLSQLAALRSCTTISQVVVCLAELERRPVRNMLEPLKTLVIRLVERLGKDVELTIEGDDVRVDADLVAPVVRELGHLIRNAVDHGIDERGIIRVRFSESPDHYVIEVVDNGRGIDVERLATRAVEKGLITRDAVETASRRELLDLAFADGLSTAEPTTDISGRGIGMSAVRAAVARAHGRIRIHSETDHGTRVEITIPRHPTAAPRAA